MAVVTKYICDKCKKEQETPEQFWTVGVVIKSHPIGISPTDSYVNGKSMQVCRGCLEDMGLVPVRVSTTALTQQLPTLEQVIRDLIRNSVEEILHEQR